MAWGRKNRSSARSMASLTRLQRAASSWVAATERALSGTHGPSLTSWAAHTHTAGA